ncbi:ribbon-helix-helix protein, CopG family [Klebsiella pneumoniae]|nr:ribbon-helix-helix protein, CopG family [Klebsiella pneumoniae]
MTAKVTRTFRIPSDLVERFDRAAEEAGIDRTKVVVDAIERFVERHEQKQLFGQSFVALAEIYAPELGLCKIGTGGSGEAGETVLQASVYPLKPDRKKEIDGEEVAYRIDNAFATVDFKNKICTITYRKFWIGGKVEDDEVSFSITWSARDDDATGITDVTVRPA